MDWKTLWQILTEAECRRDSDKWPQDVRERSAETVELCKQRMEIEGVTREQLKRLAKA